MSRLRASSILAAVVVFAAACAGPDPLAPPEIRYGFDECSHCRMIVSEERHAAAARDARGEALRFDDPGCLAAWTLAPGHELERAWVRDGAAGGWIDAAAAGYVRDPRIPTPMGSGLLAFASRDDAERQAAESGVERVLSWQDVLAPSLVVK